MLQKCFPGAPPKTKNEQKCFKIAFRRPLQRFPRRLKINRNASKMAQGLIFCFWDGSGSHFLLLGRFRVSFSPSGTVQGLIFCFWGGSGSKFPLLGDSEKGTGQISEKIANFTIKPCGQEDTSRTGPKLLLG